MARRTGNSGTTTKETKKCEACGINRPLKDYISGMDKDGKCYICTKCRRSSKFSNSFDGLQRFCELSKRGFSASLYNLCMDIAEKNNRDKIQELDAKEKAKFLVKKAIALYFSKMNLPGVGDPEGQKEDGITEDTPLSLNQVPKDLILKWGKGFKPDEYFLFEEKYQRLKNSFQLPTESHKEFLQKACVCSVKADVAMAEGDFKQSKEWMTMFKDVTSAGKLQPSQMSKADLSNGMDTFGQCSRMVEQAVDVVSILPKFKEKPKDKVDFNIWCWANYVRQLLDMPLCEYKDIWNFYEQRKQDFEESGIAFLDEEVEGDSDGL